MSDKKPKNKPDKPTLKLVTFGELPVRHKGAGDGSATDVLTRLAKDLRLTAMSVRDVELHKYVVDDAGKIRGVAVCLELDESFNAKSWDAPRDILLWQQMTVNVEGLSPSPSAEKGPKISKVKRRGGLAPEFNPFIPEAEPPIVATEQKALTVMLYRADLQPWADQPRKHFDGGLVEQLAGLMKARGASKAFPLLVRPAGNGYEIADGERRWRAAGIAEIAELPCVVEELSDAEMLELAMISSIHKKELSPMEEASGLKRMLELKSADGKALHTMESIATSLKLSVDSVSRKLALTRLAGSAVGDALDAEEITEKHARLIAQIPTAATRAKVLEMVLKPTGCPAPMPVSELKRRLVLDYVRELRGAPWKLDDATLVPVEMERGERVTGGACVGRDGAPDCPWNVASDGARKASMCMSPECYRAKEAAVHARWVAEKEAAGKVALAAAENAKVFGQDGVKLSVTTDYVDLDEKPDRADLGAKSDDLPTWGKLVKAAGVPVVLALDAKGKERALVRRDVATAAIEELDRALPPEKQILESSAKPQKQAGTKKDEFMPGLKKGEEEKARVLAAKADAARAEFVEAAKFRAVVEAARLPLRDLPLGFVHLAITVLADHLGDSPLERIMVRRGWGADDDDSAFGSVMQKLDAMEEEHFKVELLCELLMELAGSPITALDEWADLFGVDTKKAAKAAEKAFTAEAKSAAAKAETRTGVRWITDQKTEPEQFDWSEGGECKNANCAVVAVGKKIIAHITIARTVKGWVYGFSLEINGVVTGENAALKAANYSTPELATVSALTALRQAVERNGGTDEQLVMLTDYIKLAQKGGAGK